MNEDTLAITHPQNLQIDRLRAGLLDDAPQEKAQILRHVSGCVTCRSRMMRWNVAGAARLQRNSRLAGELRERRRLALDGKPSDRARHARAAQRAAAGIAATLVLMLGTVAGLDLRQLHDQRTRAPEAVRTTGVPDLYSHINFYLWVAREGSQEGGPANQS